MGRRQPVFFLWRSLLPDPGEKVAALDTLEYLEERAKRGSRKVFEAVLAKFPDTEPAEFDRLPPKRLQPTKARRRTVRKRSGRARLRG